MTSQYSRGEKEEAAIEEAPSVESASDAHEEDLDVEVGKKGVASVASGSCSPAINTAKIAATSDTVGDCHTNTDRDRRYNRVQFKHVTIREYTQVIGDNPSCSIGAPVSLGWDYIMMIDKYNLNDYEDYRFGSRRTRPQMLMPLRVRVERLMDFGFSHEMIEQASRDVEVIRMQRYQTSMEQRYRTHTQEVLEQACKSLSNVVRLRKCRQAVQQNMKDMDSNTLSTATAHSGR